MAQPSLRASSSSAAFELRGMTVDLDMSCSVQPSTSLPALLPGVSANVPGTAEDRAARAMASVAERNRLRPITLAYSKAMHSTIDLNPSPIGNLLRRGPLHNDGSVERSRRNNPSLPPIGSTGNLHARKAKQRRKNIRRRRNEASAREASGSSSRIPDEQILADPEQFLKGLEVWPEDDKLRVCFNEAVQCVKVYQGQRRWASWPFVGVESSIVKLGSSGSTPGRMAIPSHSKVTCNSVALMWDEAESATGYELEVACAHALDGLLEWRKIYRGGKLEHVVNHLGREIVGIRVRVRGYNKGGKGEWSPRSELIRLATILPPAREEIQEIPATWLTIDLAGLPELSEKDVNADLLHVTRANLVQALHANRTAIKVAFRYYALAGVSNPVCACRRID